MGALVANPLEIRRRAQQPALSRRELLALGALGLVAGAPGIARADAPAGRLTWALHVSVPPTWLDPADTLGNISPFMLFYALHDAGIRRP